MCGDDAGKDNAGRHKSKHISRSRWAHTAGCGLSLGAIPRPELGSEHMPANGGPCGTYRMVSAMSTNSLAADLWDASSTGDSGLSTGWAGRSIAVFT